jgi:hypothetical protein
VNNRLGFTPAAALRQADFWLVMAGLVPAIHVLVTKKEDVDARDKRGHDERETIHSSPR